MLEVIRSDSFDSWLVGLNDRMARLRIQVRIDRLADGNSGDSKLLREGLSELRIDYGPGYRVYFIKYGQLMIVLLAGGDKRTQNSDIKRAIAMAKLWKAEQ